MKNILLILMLSFLVSCASAGPTVVQTYLSPISRDEMAVLRVKQRMGFRILACDNIAVPSSAHYVLLQPGRHEVWFKISGQTLVETFWITNKKYLDAKAGHTYILKTKGAGIFTVGDEWFPEIIDVTNDPKLGVPDLPKENDKT